MISKIKTRFINKFSLAISVINKKTISYILMILIAYSYYASINTSPLDGFSMNLIYSFNGIIYMFLLILFISIFVINAVNNIASKYTYITRYKEKKEYIKNVAINIIFLVSCIFITNIVIFLFVFTISQKFNFDNSSYLFYGIKAYVYFIWIIVRSYLYLIFVSLSWVYISINSKNNLSKFLFAFIICFNFMILPYMLEILPDFVLKFTYIYQNNLIDYGYFISEIVTYLAYFIIKIYVLSFVFKLLNRKININIENRINLKYFITNLLKLFNKKNLLIISIYIFVNCFNFYTLYSADYLVESWLLGFASPTELGFIMILTFICSIVIINYLFIYSINYDIESTSDYIFTRMTKKKWIINKVIVLTLLLLVMRLPLYIVLNFSSGIYYDFILYEMELFFCFFIITNKNPIFKITFAIALLIIFVKEVNYITCILFGILLLMNIITIKILNKRKK